jgi:hypothetical protein
VALATDALFVTLPESAPSATMTVRVKVAVTPSASVAAVQVMVPLAPMAGVTQSKPVGSVIDWKRSDAGSVSVMTTAVASSGPSFVSAIVYWIESPGDALVAAVDFVMLRSAESGAMTVVDTPATLSVLSGSNVSLSPVTVLLIVPEEERTSTTTVNVVVAPLASSSMLQVMLPLPPTAGVVQEKAAPT